jgi:hypothetical protein
MAEQEVEMIVSNIKTKRYFKYYSIRVLAVFLALATQTGEANQIRKAIKLNLEYFIAKRLITTKDYKSSISTLL